MSNGKILGGDAPWLRDAVNPPAQRLAAEVQRQTEVMAKTATPAAVLLPPSAAHIAGVDRDASKRATADGLPIWLCYEVGAPVVVTQFMLDAIREKHPTLLF